MPLNRSITINAIPINNLKIENSDSKVRINQEENPATDIAAGLNLFMRDHNKFLS